MEDYTDELTDWGLQQTPDWLEICNTINKHELRKLGIDPQKDLLNRPGGAGKRWACGWKHDAKQLVLIAKHARSLDKVSQPPRFILDHVATVNGKRANVDQVEGDIPLAQACAVDYEYHGGVYTVLYHRARKHANPTMACDTALKLAERA